MITVAGLGPGEFSRIPGHVRQIVMDPTVTVVARTLHHPAAERLAETRDVISCDDIYRSEDSFERVYEAIAARVLAESRNGDVVYVVPGSPLMGEMSVRMLLESPEEVRIVGGESFLDLVLLTVGYDPFERGLQILNGHDLPDPLVMDKPTVIAQLDRPEILADVSAAVAAVVAEDTMATVLSDLGTDEARVKRSALDDVDASMAGLRCSMYIDPDPGGLIGAVKTMRLLREECPWDQEQTHASLIKNLVEEVYELIDAIRALSPEPEDLTSYAAVEDELGDVLLQVLFHEAIGRQSGLMDIDTIAEGLREKLVRRHPHVFGEVEANTPQEVKENWDKIKEEEATKQPGSAMDGVPGDMPALYRASKIQNRAAKVGFDWESAEKVFPKVAEELAELEAALGDEDREVAELGDLLFTVVNVARHLGIDPELALRDAVDRVETRFRQMEAEGPLQGLSLAELDSRWQRAKQTGS